MTALATAPAAPALPAITRDRYHRYTYQGKTYPGVTGILKVLDKSDALMAWAARNTAEAALSQIDSLASLRANVGDEGVIKALTARSGWKRDEAAAIGSRIHELAQLVVEGKTLGVDDSFLPHVMQYRAWWATSGWKLRLAEGFVINPDWGYGGTFDLLAYDETGKTVLADVKTGSSVYPETRLQLAAYGAATLIAPPTSPVAYPMPTVDRYVVLHVTGNNLRAIDVEVTDVDRFAFLAAVELAHWREARGKERLSR